MVSCLLSLASGYSRFVEYFGIVIICFFFKQKTAYEMRISDWSSDVCSSDLQPPDGPLPVRWRSAFGRRADGAAAGPAGSPHQRGTEIGRASCRERVCQYV